MGSEWRDAAPRPAVSRGRDCAGAAPRTRWVWPRVRAAGEPLRSSSGSSRERLVGGIISCGRRPSWWGWRRPAREAGAGRGAGNHAPRPWHPHRRLRAAATRHRAWNPWQRLRGAPSHRSVQGWRETAARSLDPLPRAHLSVDSAHVDSLGQKRLDELLLPILGGAPQLVRRRLGRERGWRVKARAKTRPTRSPPPSTGSNLASLAVPCQPAGIRGLGAVTVPPDPGGVSRADGSAPAQRLARPLLGHRCRVRAPSSESARHRRRPRCGGPSGSSMPSWSGGPCDFYLAL